MNPIFYNIYYCCSHNRIIAKSTQSRVVVPLLRALLKSNYPKLIIS